MGDRLNEEGAFVIEADVAADKVEAACPTTQSVNHNTSSNHVSGFHVLDGTSRERLAPMRFKLPEK